MHHQAMLTWDCANEAFVGFGIPGAVVVDNKLAAGKPAEMEKHKNNAKVHIVFFRYFSKAKREKRESSGDVFLQHDIAVQG